MINEYSISNAALYATGCHIDTNHKYDGQPYMVHLEMVLGYFLKYKRLIPEDKWDIAACACYAHDVIEDTRQTYNDVKSALGEEVAEIVYALTNEKGKNRAERANDKYYAGINALYPVAPMVKLCDRLANIAYSKRTKSTMLNKYRKENDIFLSKIKHEGLEPMIEEINELLSWPPTKEK